jgi:hypothetical protein
VALRRPDSVHHPHSIHHPSHLIPSQSRSAHTTTTTNEASYNNNTTIKLTSISWTASHPHMVAIMQWLLCQQAWCCCLLLARIMSLQVESASAKQPVVCGAVCEGRQWMQPIAKVHTVCGTHLATRVMSHWVDEGSATVFFKLGLSSL